MTQAADTLGPPRASPTRLIGLVGAAHFVSHYFIILLAPLMPFVRAEYGVSYTEIGFAFSAFSIVSAALQTPAGFLVDRIGPRTLLIGGLLIGAAAFIAVGMTHSFWLLVALFAIAGVGNTVYHPADYSLLSHNVPLAKIGRAYSVHSFSGMLGSAVAPPTLLILESVVGWRGAFICAGILGLVVAASLCALPAAVGKPVPRPRPSAAPVRDGWALLLSLPILLNLVFFLLLSVISAGVTNYTVVALAALYGTPVSVGNTALTANLLLTAGGVLIGGWVVGRTSRHGQFAALGLALTAIGTFIVGEVDMSAAALIAVMALSGFFSGIIMPSRDMLVRAITPPGSFGKVFGFVSTGFNLGGVIAPLIFGWMMDHGSPRMVFLVAAGLTAAAILTVIWQPRTAGS